MKASCKKGIHVLRLEKTTEKPTHINALYVCTESGCMHIETRKLKKKVSEPTRLC